MNRYLVIGGTQGIGRASAERLSADGHDVMVLGRNRPEGLGSCEFRRLDVADWESVEDVLARVKESWPALNGVVYAVGVTAPPKSIEEFDPLEWNRMVTINVTGALLSLKVLYSALKNGSGRVVVVGSLASRVGSRLSGLEYTITKSALSGMVKHLALQWASEGILINSVLPGMTRTRMLEDSVPEPLINQISERIPLGRVGQPEEIAHAIEFLVSEKNTYITGAGVDVNGGFYLSS